MDPISAAVQGLKLFVGIGNAGAGTSGYHIWETEKRTNWLVILLFTGLIILGAYLFIKHAKK